jgi:phage terminase large subunit
MASRRRRNSIVREVNFNDNPWFPDVLRVEMEYDRSRDVDKFNHIWRGQYRANSEARVFRNWRVEDFESDPNAEYRQGADFGFSIDPSCLVRCYIKERVIYVDHEAWGLASRLLICLSCSCPFPMLRSGGRPPTAHVLRRSAICAIMAFLASALRSRARARSRRAWSS